MGHTGELIFGELEGRDVLFMSGEFMLMKGIVKTMAYPVRLLSQLGIKNLLLTNASGGINESYSPGDLCIITDQINLTGGNPLIGKNDDFLGQDFQICLVFMTKNSFQRLRKFPLKVS